MTDPFAEEERRARRDRQRFWRNLTRIGDFYAWLVGAIVVFALLAPVKEEEGSHE